MDLSKNAGCQSVNFNFKMQFWYNTIIDCKGIKLFF